MSTPFETGSSEAAQKAATPGTLLIVVGILFVLLNLFALLWAVLSGFMNMGVYGMQATTGRSEDLAVAGLGAGMSVVFLVISLVIDVVGVIGGGVVAMAGRKLMALQSPTFVTVGAVIAIVQPLLSLCAGMFGGCGLCGAFLWMPLVLLGIGSGIFAFTVVNDPTVRDSFDAI